MEKTNLLTKDSENILRTKPIGKLLLKFSIPAIIAMMVNAIYNMVDRIFIGNAPNLKDGLDALTYAFPLMMILLGLSLMIGVGGATYFSIKQGEKREDIAQKVLNNSLGMTVIIGVLISIIGLIFAQPILKLLGTTDLCMPLALEYVQTIFVGNVFAAIGVWGNNFIRADGSPIISMLSISLGAVVNIILDAVFIFGFQWGIFGAALATIIGQISSSAWVILYFLRKKSKYHLKISQFIPSIDVIAIITRLGFASFIIQVSNSVVQIVLAHSLNIYAVGINNAVGALGVVNSFQTLAIMPVLGITHGAMPILSFNKGAGLHKRVARTVTLSMIFATIFTVIAFAIAMFFPATIMKMFDNGQKGQDFLVLGEMIFRKWFLMTAVVGCQIVITNYFMSIGKASIASFLSLTRQILLLVPLILILPHFLGLDGIFFAAPISDLVSFLLSITCLLINQNIEKKKREKNTLGEQKC